MPSETFLKCACKNCGGNIEFPEEGIGRSIRCPHCREETQLVRTTSRWEPPSPRRSKSILVIALVFCSLAGATAIGILAARKHSGTPLPRVNEVSAVKPAPADETSPPIRHRKKIVPPVKKISPDDADWNGLPPGEVVLEKSGSRLLYAVGTIRNESDRQRFAVKVDLDLFDANETKIGSASDYTPIIEPRKEWRFKALVTDPKAVRAEVSGIKEN